MRVEAVIRLSIALLCGFPLCGRCQDLPHIPIQHATLDIDGNLSDWEDFRWEPRAVNTPFESLLGGGTYLSFNTNGIFIGLKYGPSASSLLKAGSDISIDIFIDSRELSATGTYKWDKNVVKLTFSTEQSLSSVISGSTQSGALAPNGKYSLCRSSYLNSNIVTEISIPWKVMPFLSKLKLKNVSIGIRLSSSVEGKPIQIGLDEFTDELIPEENADVFSPYLLDYKDQKHADSSEIFFSSGEILINDQPSLILKWAEINEGPKKENTIFYRIQGLTAVLKIDLDDSKGGLFKTAQKIIPLYPGLQTESINIDFYKNDVCMHSELVSLKMYSAVRDGQNYVRSIKFRKEFINDEFLPELWQDAMNAAAQCLQTAPDGCRPVRRRFYESSFLSSVEEKMNSLKQMAGLCAGEIINRRETIHAYRREDGCLSPFRVYWPESYDSNKKYPLVFVLHGKNAYCTLDRFILKEGSEFENTIASNKDCFVIALYGAGNNFEMVGVQEIRKIMDWCRSSIDFNPLCVTIMGNSYGGSMALYLAARIPNFFSNVEIISGDPFIGGERFGQKKLSGKNLLKTAVVNLKDTPIRFTIGEKENASLYRANSLAFDHLKSSGNLVEFNIVPLAGHSIVFPARWICGNPNKFIQPFSLYSDSTCDGNFGYIEFIGSIDRSRPSLMNINFSGNNIFITTENLDHVKFDIDKLGWFNKAISIDGSPMQISPNSAIDLTKIAETWEPYGFNKKGKKNSMAGPAIEFLKRDFIIIFGTGGNSPNHLEDRAYSILSQLSGTRSGRWASRKIFICDDITVDKTMLANRDLFLIGGAGENAITAQLLPILKYGQSFMTTDTIVDANIKGVIVKQLLQLNPLNSEKYVFIESASDISGYSGSILKVPYMDASVSQWDGANWQILMKKMFSDDWD